MTDIGTEKGLAGTREDNRLPELVVSGPGNWRDLKIHESVMPDINNQIRIARDGDGNLP